MTSFIGTYPVNKPNDNVSQGHYPNDSTIRNLYCIFMNGIFQASGASTLTTLALNAPIRLYNIWSAFKRNEYLVVTCNAVALASLFFLPGKLVAIWCDVLSEMQNMASPSCTFPQQKDFELPDFSRTKTFDNGADACKYLGLPQDCSDLKRINEIVDNNVRAWKWRQQNPHMSLYFAWFIQIIIDNFENARKACCEKHDLILDEQDNVVSTPDFYPAAHGNKVSKRTPLSQISVSQKAYVIFLNGMCHATKAALALTLSLNAPLRIYSLWSASQEKNYIVLACNLVACGALLIPYGPLIAMGCDIISLIGDARNANTPLEKDAGVGLPFDVRPIDFASHVQACRILYLPDSSCDEAKINKQADKFISVLKKKLNLSQVGCLYFNQINTMIENIDNARKYLITNSNWIEEVD